MPGELGLEAPPGFPCPQVPAPPASAPLFEPPAPDPPTLPTSGLKLDAPPPPAV